MWRKLINGLLTAAVFGAAGAIVQNNIDPTHFDWKHTGGVALASAVISIANWLRTSPWDSTALANQEATPQNPPAK